MKTLAVIVTRGTYNNLLQACELVRIAALAGTRVSVLFRDEAAGKLTHDKVKELSLSEGYRGREVRLRELLRERKLHDLPAILRETKEKGDVKFSVCRDSVEYFDLRVEQLISELDEVQSVDAFWKEEVASADHVLTF
ncbi:MAG: DsrE family protein [Nitrospiraceae bacterium]